MIDEVWALEPEGGVIVFFLGMLPVFFMIAKVRESDSGVIRQ